MKNPQRIVRALAAYLDVLVDSQTELYTSVCGRPVVVGQRIPISGERGALYVELRVGERKSTRDGRLYECLLVVRLDAAGWSLLVGASGLSVHTAVVAAAQRAVRGTESRLNTHDSHGGSCRVLENGGDWR